MNKKIMSINLGFCLLLSSCGSWFKDHGGDQVAQIRPLFEPGELTDALKSGGDSARQIAPLIQPSTCAEARDAVVNLMLTQMRSQFDADLRSFEPYLGRPGVAERGLARGSAPEAAVDRQSDVALESGPDDFTTTNNQVDGVEEGDFVKNTGTHMYLAQENKIHIVKSWPAPEMQTLATIELEDKVSEMVFAGENTLVVTGRPELLPREGSSSSEVGDGNSMALTSPALDDIEFERSSRYAHNSVSLTVIDISLPESPVVKDRIVFRGEYKTVRRIDKSIRMVVNQHFSYPEGIQTFIPWDEKRRISSKEDYRSRLEFLYQQNKEQLLGMSLNDLLNTSRSWYHRTEQLKNPEGLFPVAASASCADFYIPQIPSQRFGLTKIVTLDLGGEAPRVQQDVILGNEGLAYASKNSLYLASSSWNWWDGRFADLPKGAVLNHTILHRFDLSKPDRAGYQGSGIVEGNLNDQFSMDEFDDILRVATTVERIQSAEHRRGWRTSSVNRVTTLSLQNQFLTVLGQSPDLAEGESIFSARFSGTRGFIVTFRQVDPLFSFDLSDPAEPKVLGELKIPGFSEYMQFIDQQHILTVGRDADPATGWSRGLKVSLFDVGDMQNLKEVDHHILGGQGWQRSEATSNHQAFTYFGRTGHLAIPYQSNENGYQSTLQLFKVDPETGIMPAGQVHLNDMHAEQSTRRSWAHCHLQLRRSVFADDVLYAISHGGIKAVLTAQPDKTLSTVEFPCDASSPR